MNHKNKIENIASHNISASAGSGAENLPLVLNKPRRSLEVSHGGSAQVLGVARIKPRGNNQKKDLRIITLNRSFINSKFDEIRSYEEFRRVIGELSILAGFIEFNNKKFYYFINEKLDFAYNFYLSNLMLGREPGEIKRFDKNTLLKVFEKSYIFYSESKQRLNRLPIVWRNKSISALEKISQIKNKLHSKNFDKKLCSLLMQEINEIRDECCLDRLIGQWDEANQAALEKFIKDRDAIIGRVSASPSPESHKEQRHEDEEGTSRKWWWLPCC